MYYVYLLKNSIAGKVYIGYTADLKERIKQHNHNKTKSTKNRGKHQLIYYEAFKSKTDARKREIALKKQSRQKEFLLNNLEDSLK
ncbi:MAG: Excinuclease abc c subunit domain protein [Berkelbacteria bacterium GW2011_GWA2_35_9]|uniref:Excinuclease abc c subunit domain protein n=1 Tax=Berkelbacteria bacterium GW2011_GWA2_35_9 TaxID=1618333 RepID=A0A0G0D663_9BACT|nr:MAG: Excinuclease abc c subunit domain protein [Berkelbacteria bacterium GW2011_GWA2_35_9]